MAMLHVVATPIGNLADLPPRAARALEDADAVYAEDTRRTATLLRHIGAHTPLRSLHAHNEARRVQEVLTRLDAGESVTLVSDAGTPLISDPGGRLVRAVLDAGHTVVPVPGPSAVLAALVGSGLPADRFAFLGFVPRKGRERSATLDRIVESEETIVVFESPERLVALLADLEARCVGEREACVARELTKLHETFARGTLAELRAYYEHTPARGEVTVVVAAAAPAAPEDRDVEARREAAALLAAGTPPSSAAREVARRIGIPRNRAYALVQTLQEDDGPA
ncbi:MAG: 16S rRNA (cytidine(1402)-2'-O)-methyltransferase [Gemmatimonadetes bacterium]|nr:16S rRNA (cytidine(1402)-2'-O)-methyltransferase [Gemmatimonadota bacterium]MBT8405189.1 16S rRNA (cytidine(1402)-2'-O)-methyltransferase [Gemmatimonadota bacterium]NNF38995.1 16S rRNA (cytidine(1402)-2'-O)-methyltransferase [Gemmatimonadota bacterium]NNK61941.1 16S rRNA (cytidine(1402)-2'-O)-methyltransferase [Gemmatimonadota bacterium]